MGRGKEVEWSVVQTSGLESNSLFFWGTQMVWPLAVELVGNPVKQTRIELQKPLTSVPVKCNTLSLATQPGRDIQKKQHSWAAIHIEPKLLLPSQELEIGEHDVVAMNSMGFLPTLSSRCPIPFPYTQHTRPPLSSKSKHL